MRPLHAYLAAPLYWTQPKALTRAYELHANAPDSDVHVAMLCFDHPFGSLANGQTTTGWWSFRRAGFFRSTVTVCSRGCEDTVAVYRPRWTGTEGEITTGHGTYTFKTANFWGTRYRIQTPEGEPLVTYRSGCPNTRLRDLFKSQSTVTITTSGSNEPYIDLLVVLGWYLIVLSRDDTAAVAVTSSVVAPAS
jgi:hypothetical protein